MFTGIITDIGEVLEIKGASDMRAIIACAYDPALIDIGASIACAGVCLTVVEKGKKGALGCFTVDVSAETIGATTIGAWQVGTRVNLEHSLKLGDEMGGHMVSGHVDDVAEVVANESIGDSQRLRFRTKDKLGRHIAQKGSICLDGTSFTVNDVSANEFDINIIPHTLQVTTWGERQIGDRVNLEIDVIARYVARLYEENSD